MAGVGVGNNEQWGSGKIASTAEGGTTGERVFLAEIAQRGAWWTPAINQVWYARPGIALYAADVTEEPYGKSSPAKSDNPATHYKITWTYRDRPAVMTWADKTKPQTCFWQVSMTPMIQMLDLGEGNKFKGGDPIPGGNVIPVSAVEITVVGDENLFAWKLSAPCFAPLTAEIGFSSRFLLGKICTQRYLGAAPGGGLMPDGQLLFENEVYEAPRLIVNGWPNNVCDADTPSWVRRFTRTFLWRLVSNTVAGVTTYGGHNFLWNPRTSLWEETATKLYQYEDFKYVFPFKV